jgi:putative membrane protein
MIHKIINIKPQQPTIKDLSNHAEYSNFLKTALAWKGSVTPKIIKRVLTTGVYAAGIVWLMKIFPEYAMSIAPFEYSGAVLGLLLVVRVNSGLDRWWEARKLWGNIVNQSRNLAITGYQYSPSSPFRDLFLKWVASWPHAMRAQLRNERNPKTFEPLLGPKAATQLTHTEHMPMYCKNLKIMD